MTVRSIFLDRMLVHAMPGREAHPPCRMEVPYATTGRSSLRGSHSGSRIDAHFDPFDFVVERKVEPEFVSQPIVSFARHRAEPIAHRVGECPVDQARNEQPCSVVVYLVQVDARYARSGHMAHVHGALHPVTYADLGRVRDEMEGLSGRVSGQFPYGRRYENLGPVGQSPVASAQFPSPSPSLNDREFGLLGPFPFRRVSCGQAGYGGKKDDQGRQRAYHGRTV